METNLPYESWYTALFQRRSRRIYSSKIPTADKIYRLRKACDIFHPFPEARTVLIENPAENIFRGFIGSYGQIKNVPYCVAFVGDMRSPHVQEAVGYTGEGIILEATSLALNTCWVAGFFYPEKAAKQIKIKNHEKVLAVTPIGIATDQYTFQEKTISVFGRLHKRKPLSKLHRGTIRKEWMKNAILAARLAPSARNRQPWRFILHKNAIIISVGKSKNESKISKRLDCGIAMLHVELGALSRGIKGNWEFLSPPDVAKFTVKKGDV